MSRLLHSGFVRAWKDPLVRMGMVTMFLLSVVLIGIAYFTKIKNHEFIYLDEIVYLYLPIIGIMSAIFCSHLSGQEYCDGAIRNKLVAGHSRVAIYLSDFIINIGVVFCLTLVTFLTEAILGGLLLDGIQATFSQVFVAILGSLLAIMALCAIFTLIAMSGQNHRTSDAICLLIVCILVFVSLCLMLVMVELKGYDEERKEEGEVYITEEDALYTILKNRELYEFSYDLLPTGQIAQYVSKDVQRPKQLPLYSAGIIVVTTTFGVLLFRRKNIL